MKRLWCWLLCYLFGHKPIDLADDKDFLKDPITAMFCYCAGIKICSRCGRKL